jgi:GAF domain-containing protein
VENGGSTQHRGLRAVVDPRLAELELGELLDELTERACAALDAVECAIVLADGPRYGSSEPTLLELAQRSIECGEVVTSAEGTAVPLLARSTVHGAVAARMQHLADEELEILQLVANRAAVGVEHHNSLEAERLARRRLENLQSVTDAALAHLDLHDLLDELLNRVRTVLDVDTAAILLLDEETDELVARAAKGLEEEVEAGVRIPVGLGFAGRVAADRRPVVLPDVDHADVLNPILRQKGIKTMLGVPLLVEGGPIGVLHVGTLVPH